MNLDWEVELGEVVVFLVWAAAGAMLVLSAAGVI